MRSGKVFAAMALLLSAGPWLVRPERAGAQSVKVPMFEVDPFWPKPLPNNWILGSAIGVWVDEDDVIWMVHRSSATLSAGERAKELGTGDCCAGAPPVLAFDKEGNLLHAWGGKPGEDYQGAQWPESNHGIFVDHLGYVWLGGNGAGDAHVLKLTKDGKVAAQFGHAGARKAPPGPAGQALYIGNSHDSTSFGRVADISVDPETNEAYLADGYLNRRVAVIDAETGKMKRFWGAYGNAPDDKYEFSARGPGFGDEPAAPQFRGPVHCADLSNDGLVYVCDRQSNRLQVFRKDGTFVKEAFFARGSLGYGTTFDVAFSRDPEQRYLFLVDGQNMKIRILLRETLEELTNFGSGGRQPGQFYTPHSIALDSEGNVYTTETFEGKRIQKFVFKGEGPVTQREQGTIWPER